MSSIDSKSAFGAWLARAVEMKKKRCLPIKLYKIIIKKAENGRKNNAVRR